MLNPVPRSLISKKNFERRRK